MKLIRYDGGRIGVTDGVRVADVTRHCGVGEDWPPVAMNRLIRDFETLRSVLEAALGEGETVAFDRVFLETPVPWPNKLPAFPVNYHDHAAEMATTGLADVIATGTPAGVGPIVDGDVVRIEIERVGAMSVRVEQGALGRNPVLAKPCEFERAVVAGGRA